MFIVKMTSQYEKYVQKNKTAAKNVQQTTIKASADKKSVKQH